MRCYVDHGNSDVDVKTKINIDCHVWNLAFNRYVHISLRGKRNIVLWYNKLKKIQVSYPLPLPFHVAVRHTYIAFVLTMLVSPITQYVFVTANHSQLYVPRIFHTSKQRQNEECRYIYTKLRCQNSRTIIQVDHTAVSIALIIIGDTLRTPTQEKP